MSDGRTRGEAAPHAHALPSLHTASLSQMRYSVKLCAVLGSLKATARRDASAAQAHANASSARQRAIRRHAATKAHAEGLRAPHDAQKGALHLTWAGSRDGVCAPGTKDVCVMRVSACLSAARPYTSAPSQPCDVTRCITPQCGSVRAVWPSKFRAAARNNRCGEQAARALLGWLVDVVLRVAHGHAPRLLRLRCVLRRLHRLFVLLLALVRRSRRRRAAHGNDRQRPQRGREA